VNSARHPYRLAARRLEQATLERHISDLVQLVLLTAPRERLHRPGFGAGIGPAALFEPLDGGLGTIVEMRARGSLEAALGDRIEVVSVNVQTVGESTIEAAVEYRLRPAGATRTSAVTVHA
jgi:phage baseplate assembly protein W